MSSVWSDSLRTAVIRGQLRFARRQDLGVFDNTRTTPTWQAPELITTQGGFLNTCSAPLGRATIFAPLACDSEHTPSEPPDKDLVYFG